MNWEDLVIKPGEIEIVDSPSEKVAQLKEAEVERRSSSRRHTEVLELSQRYEYRRAFSETKLLDALGSFEFQEGHSYNFITAGDVDALSYLKAIIRCQDLEYCLLSTWVMAAEDIFQLKEWMEAGRIRHLDCYLGEIFPSSYKVEYRMLKDLMEKTGGKLAYFRNHSKIFAGYGSKFYFGIQMSCNINTNPRTENGCITIDRGLFEFYKQYFDGIKSF